MTITAATFLVFSVASRVLTPSRSSMASRLCLVKGAFRRASPVPFKPTTMPYPTSMFSRTPSNSTISLMRDLASAAPVQAIDRHRLAAISRSVARRDAKRMTNR